MKGIQDLIRPCATLARYEAALAAGTITQDVMVFIADVRQIRWKGEIYDCSVTAVTEDGKTYIHADGLNDSDDGYYFLPSSAPGDDPAHTFAMLSDLEGLGGGGGDTGDTGDIEAVAAAGLVDLNERLLHLQNELFLYAGKKDIAEVQQVLTDALLENEEILAGALTDHETRIKESEKRLSDCITRYENNLQKEIESNEKVVAYAFVEVRTIVEDLQKRIYQLENRL